MNVHFSSLVLIFGGQLISDLETEISDIANPLETALQNFDALNYKLNFL